MRLNFDPCFQGAYGSGLVARPETPWGNRVILLHLTKRLPRRDPRQHRIRLVVSRRSQSID